jgi:lipopolysaccharide/colanic/teichoic acid biosynthesis glycosyltransferase
MKHEAIDRAVRRSADLVASTLALVVLSPLLATVALLVRLDSPGPALFRQVRVGRNGRPFQILKFRTMRADQAEASRITGSGDPRITRLGGRLRSTKIDELPQLVNVFLGQMSIVGPRPEVPEFVDLWPSSWRPTILSVRPGLADPVTLQLRREEELLAASPNAESFYKSELLPLKVAGYSQYVATRTLSSDCIVIAQAVRAVVRG